MEKQVLQKLLTKAKLPMHAISAQHEDTPHRMPIRLQRKMQIYHTQVPKGSFTLATDDFLVQHCMSKLAEQYTIISKPKRKPHQVCKQTRSTEQACFAAGFHQVSQVYTIHS